MRLQRLKNVGILISLVLVARTAQGQWQCCVAPSGESGCLGGVYVGSTLDEAWEASKASPMGPAFEGNCTSDDPNDGSGESGQGPYGCGPSPAPRC